MKMLRWVSGGVVVWVTPLLGGCILDLSNLGGGNEHGTPSGGTTSGGDSGLSRRRGRRESSLV